eukprot:TRINITY_DN5421_c0_g2_i7.p1 TRINITY_DN5421_c0_g2~~TRINITY_DN5421_c0_g2_i7.p1  ORF type:complete len:357 (+),score=113.76 TRINITY_DN5421_c0_g2_i7:122-1192(+)
MNGKEPKKYASEISLFSMREGLNPLGKFKTRLEEMERVVNILESDQDALLALNDFRGALPSLLKLQQPINTLSKKIQSAFAKDEKITKTLEELKDSMKEFHTRTYNKLFNEDNAKTKRVGEIMGDIHAASENVEDMQIKLEGSIREVEYTVTEELKKLQSDFLKEAEKTKEEAMKQLYEADKALQKKKHRLKEEPVQEPEEDLSPVNVDRIVSNEVSACIEKMLEEFSDSIPVGAEDLLLAKREYRSLELIQLEENEKQEIIKHKVITVEKNLQDLLQRNIKETESRNVIFDDLKSRATELQEEVNANAKARTAILEYHAAESLLSKLKETDTHLKNVITRLQRRINAYSDRITKS